MTRHIISIDMKRLMELSLLAYVYFISNHRNNELIRGPMLE